MAKRDFDAFADFLTVDDAAQLIEEISGVPMTVRNLHIRLYREQLPDDAYIQIGSKARDHKVLLFLRPGVIAYAKDLKEKAAAKAKAKAKIAAPTARPALKARKKTTARKAK